MTAPAKPWSEMTPAEKGTAVKAAIAEGLTMEAVAVRVGAPSRGAVAGVVNRLKERGEFPRTQRRTRSPGPAKPPKLPKPPKAANPRRESKRAKEPRAFHAPVCAAPAHRPPTPKVIVGNARVRRFERGASTDITAIQFYMAGHGYTIGLAPGASTYKVSNGDGRPKIVKHRELFDLVDTCRRKDGLQPFIPERTA